MSKAVLIVLFLLITSLSAYASPEGDAYTHAIGVINLNERVSREYPNGFGSTDPRTIKGYLDEEKIWDDSLKTLVLSSSEEGDKYLAKLAAYPADGALGENFSCAATHRMATHGKFFLRYLQEYRDHYEKFKPCSSAGLEIGVVCMNKEQYASMVKNYATLEGKPEDNSDVDCSELFK